MQFVKPYWKHLGLSFFFTFLFSLFSGMSIYLTIPLLETLFRQGGIARSSGIELSRLPTIIDTIKQAVSAAFNDLIFTSNPAVSLLRICLVMLIAFLLKNLFGYLASYLMAYAEEGVTMDLRNTLYRHIHNLSLGYFTNERTGDLISRITNDVSIVNGGVVASLGTLTREPFLITVFLVLAVSISWKLTLVSLLVFPFSLVIISRIGVRLYHERGVTQERMADIVSVLQETIYGVKVVKAFGMEEFENRKFKRQTRHYLKSILKITRLRNLASPITEFLGIMAGAVIIYYGGLQVIMDESIEPSQFLGFLLLIFQIMPPVKELSNVHNRIQEAIAGGKRILDILDTDPYIKDAPNPIPLDEFRNSIEFRDVSFAYERNVKEAGNGELVLRNISLHVRKGEILAIVGPSGGGKSTLIDLIPRFYDPLHGRILVDGIDLRVIRLRTLREKIGIVTQETILFNDTVRNNIAYGLDDCPMERIFEVAKAANAHDFILEMPQGYDTVIGERGVKLSGGQRQRLSIARALLKNPPIMIFDEATSALDSESELLVQDAIERLMKNRTSFVIAHRLSTIRNANRIIVIDRGEIVQEGTHGELIRRRGGLYKKLYEMQFNM